MRVLARDLAAFVVLCGLSGVCPARDVMEWERLEAWDMARRLVEGDERILKLATGTDRAASSTRRGSMTSA